jgi:Tfp pilus assembly protein PilN
MNGKPPVSRTFLMIVFACVLLLSLAFVAVQARTRKGQITEIEGQVKQERDKGRRLAAVFKRVRLHDVLEHEVHTRMDLMQRLLQNQRSPVPVMKAVGKVLSNVKEVSVETLEYDSGHVALHGKAPSADSVSNLRGALERSGIFSCSPLPAPGQETGGSGKTFELDCALSPPAKPSGT